VGKLKDRLFFEKNTFKSPNRISHTYINWINLTYRPEKPLFNGHAHNKIHLFVKHNYILYTVCKLAEYQENYPENSFLFKFQPFNYQSNLKVGHEGFRSIEINGGPMATVVIYATSDKALMKKLIEDIVRLFPDHDEIGLMDLEGDETLSPFNVRINKLVSYACTDRIEGLKRIEENISSLRIPTTGYERSPFEGRKPSNVWRAPSLKIETSRVPWFTHLQKSCGPDTHETVNKQSQLYLGIDACDSEGRPIDYTAKCNNLKYSDIPDLTKGVYKFCYLPKDTLAPPALGEIEDTLEENRRPNISLFGPELDKKIERLSVIKKYLAAEYEKEGARLVENSAELETYLTNLHNAANNADKVLLKREFLNNPFYLARMKQLKPLPVWAEIETKLQENTRNKNKLEEIQKQLIRELKAVNREYDELRQQQDELHQQQVHLKELFEKKTGLEEQLRALNSAANGGNAGARATLIQQFERANEEYITAKLAAQKGGRRHRRTQQKRRLRRGTQKNRRSR